MSNTSQSNFNFHDIVGVKTNCATEYQKSFFDEEYNYHRVDALSETMPSVAFNYRELSDRSADMTDYQHKVLAKFGYNIDIQDHRIEVEAAGNEIGIPIAHHMLLHTSLRYLTARQNALLLHSGAVAKNGKSILFSGKGGTGKTTMTSLILSSGKGWNIHADDYVFLSGNTTKTYVTRAHLYRDLLRWVPEIRNKLTFKERVALSFFGFVREKTNEGIKWPVRLEFSRLWPDISIADEATPGGLILLAREDIPSPTLVENKDLDAVTKELVEMNFFEARHFINLVKKAGKYSDEWYKDWFKLEQKNLYEFFSKVPLFTLTLPKHSGKNSNDQVLSMIEEIVS